MLYTVRPLERVYADPTVFQQNKKAQNAVNANTDYREVILPNGRIVTRRDGENYIVESINSTDLKDYLNEEYFPGKNYKI